MIIDGKFLVIEWIKEKIHEPEVEQQTATNSCTVTMDDFRVGEQEKTRFSEEYDLCHVR